jgi:hypothetical protein
LISNIFAIILKGKKAFARKEREGIKRRKGVGWG